MEAGPDSRPQRRWLQHYTPSEKATGRALCSSTTVLLLAGCSSLTPGQRIAVYCNPVSHAADLAIIGVRLVPWGLGPDITDDENWFRYPGHDCVDAIKDQVQRAESANTRATTPAESPASPQEALTPTSEE